MSTEDLIPLVVAARDLGVTADAIKHAMRRAHRPVRKVGRLNAARLSDLEWYARQRERRAPAVARRPKGWWGSKQVMAFLEVDSNSVVLWQRRGEFDAVRVGRLYFYDPEGVRAFAQRREGIAPGWLSVPDLARAQEWAPSTVYRAVKSLRLETRTYYVKASVGRNRPTRLCIREADLPTLTARMTAPASYPGCLTTVDLAAITGATETAVRLWYQRGLPTSRDRWGRAWCVPQVALTWLDAQRDSRMRPYAERLRQHLAQQQPGRAA